MYNIRINKSYGKSYGISYGETYGKSYGMKKTSFQKVFYKYKNYFFIFTFLFLKY